MVLGAASAALVNADSNLVASDEGALIPLPSSEENSAVSVSIAALELFEFFLNDISGEVEGLKSGKSCLGLSDRVGDARLNSSPAVSATYKVDGTSTLVEEGDFTVGGGAIEDCLANGGCGHFIYAVLGIFLREVKLP